MRSTACGSSTRRPLVPRSGAGCAPAHGRARRVPVHDADDDAIRSIRAVANSPGRAAVERRHSSQADVGHGQVRPVQRDLRRLRCGAPDHRGDESDAVLPQARARRLLAADDGLRRRRTTTPAPPTCQALGLPGRRRRARWRSSRPRATKGSSTTTRSRAARRFTGAWSDPIHPEAQSEPHPRDARHDPGGHRAGDRLPDDRVRSRSR